MTLTIIVGQEIEHTFSIAHLCSGNTHQVFAKIAGVGIIRKHFLPVEIGFGIDMRIGIAVDRVHMLFFIATVVFPLIAVGIMDVGRLGFELRFGLGLDFDGVAFQEQALFHIRFGFDRGQRGGGKGLLYLLIVATQNTGHTFFGMTVFFITAAGIVDQGDARHAQIPCNASGNEERQDGQDRCGTAPAALFNIQLCQILFNDSHRSLFLVPIFCLEESHGLKGPYAEKYLSHDLLLFHASDQRIS